MLWLGWWSVSYKKQQERTILDLSHEEKLRKDFLAVRTEKHMSNLDKKVEELSALEGF